MRFAPGAGVGGCRQAAQGRFAQLEGKARPTLYMASTVWSKPTRLPMPASEVWALTSAVAAPEALRFWQGTSTRPATRVAHQAHHVGERVAGGVQALLGVPPSSSTHAAAAIAAAEPISAWQPPSAPETVALRVIR